MKLFKASEENPILIDKFINNAMEVDVDAISDGKDVYVARNNAAHRRSWNSFWRLCMLLCHPYQLKRIF